MLRRFAVSSEPPPDPVEGVPPRDASTVMLVRDAPAGLEVFVLRRRASLAFAAGMHVFPGGGVDDRDGAPCAWTGPSAAELAGALSATAGQAHALVVAAVRETFEECGVLLASRPGEDAVVAAHDAGWEAEREALAAGRVTLADVLDRHRLVLRADLLRPWAHWLTPVHEPRRFDTRFFAAALPPGVAAREVLGEADRTAWVVPAAALADADAGRLALMPPTRVCLEELDALGSVAAVLAARRSPSRVMPWWVADGDGSVLVADL